MKKTSAKKGTATNASAPKHKGMSNKFKIGAAIVGTAALIGAAFGIRKVMKNKQAEQKKAGKKKR